jgi:hypothetical protein
MANNNISFKGDLLIGKSNYIDWVKRASLFLEINGFMPYIDNTEHAPDKSLYYESDSEGHVTKKPYSPELAIRYIDKKAEFERNQTKAFGAIKSIISQENVDRFKDKITASSLWDAIKATYGETSLETIARYFNKIIEVNYNSFKNADEYTSHIQSSALYLKDLGHALPEPFIAILLFKGLSSSFESFSSRKYEEIANKLKFNKTSNKRAEGAPLINIPKLIADIISEESRFSTNEDFIVNKAFINKSKNKPLCKHCKKKGHIINKCWILHPKLRNSTSNKDESIKSNDNNKSKNESTKAVMTALAYNLEDSSLDNKTGHMTPELILDSGASEHYTYNRDWFLNYNKISNKSIKTAGGHVLPVIGQGDIPIKVAKNGTYIDVIIKGVFYVPGLKAILISSKELTNKGWEITFKAQKAVISHSKLGLDVTANWNQRAYYLNVLIDYNALEKVVYSATSQLTNKITLDLIH